MPDDRKDETAAARNHPVKGFKSKGAPYFIKRGGQRGVFLECLGMFLIASNFCQSLYGLKVTQGSKGSQPLTHPLRWSQTPALLQMENNFPPRG